VEFLIPVLGHQDAQTFGGMLMQHHIDVEALCLLSNEDFDKIGMPMGVKAKIRQAIQDHVLNKR
jgi:hypothetical protein